MTNDLMPAQALLEKSDSSTSRGVVIGKASLHAKQHQGRYASEMHDSAWAEPAFLFHEHSPSAYYLFVSSNTSVVPSSSELLQAAVAASQYSLETSLATSDASVKTVLSGVYELDGAGRGRSAAQEVMLFVEQRLKRNGLVEANRLLELADPSRLSSRSLLGLIRSTSRVRDRLPAWKKTYLDSRDKIAESGKNPDLLFLGLPKPDSIA